MPLERSVVNALVKSMEEANWHVEETLPHGDTENPVRLTFHKGEATQRLIVHSRRLTPQWREGEEPSSHGRPPGEFHAQMIFDGDQRGRGVRNYLRQEENALALLLGYYLPEDEYILVAYDPSRHSEYAYSKSLQAKQETLEQAERYGIAFQTRTTGERIVAFRASFFPEYVDSFESLHTAPEAYLQEEADVDTRPDVRAVLLPEEEREAETTPPELTPRERRHLVSTVTRKSRNAKFAEGINRVYDRCAICGFQYGNTLEAAHIVPVSDPESTDTYDNGMGLCPLCHKLYDKGYVLVNGEYEIGLNPRYRKTFQAQDKAGSLDDLADRLRHRLLLPEDETYWPSPERLNRVYAKRSKAKGKSS